MKKQITKKFRKGLSLFLAVLMVLTTWVWVAPEKASAVATSSIKSTNEAELKKVTGSTTITANKVGKFAATNSCGGDEDSEVTKNGSTYYKNVLYSPDNSWGGHAATKYLTDSNSTNVNYYMFYPTTVLMYDGATTPQMGAVFCADPSDNYKVNLNSVWLKNNANGLSLGNTCWKGYTSGAVRFYYNIMNGTDFLSTTGSYVSPYARTTDEDNWEFFANIIKFTGSMGDSEFSRTIKPDWGILTGTNKYWKGVKWRNGASHNTFMTASTPIYVINAKPLKAAYTKATETYNAIYANPGKYSTASVKKFVELYNALLDANPNNYDWTKDTASKVAAYAEDAKAAVDAWNAFSLKESSIVTFDNMFNFDDFSIGGSLTVDERTEKGFTVTSTGDDGNTGFSYSIPVEPGKTYVLSADVDFTPVSGGYDMYIHTLDVNQAGETTATPDTSNGAHREGNVYISLTTQTTNKKPYIRFTAGSNTRYIKIRFDANAPGNKLTVNNIRVYDDSKFASENISYVTSAAYEKGTAYGTLPTPTRTCYTFAGWVDVNGKAVDTATLCDSAPTKILYSTWKDPKHSTSNKEIINGYNATCTDPGLNDAERCLDCGEIYKPHTVIDALGHQYDGGTVTDPTCQADGYITYKCLRPGCNYSYTKPGTPHTGEEHDWNIVGTAATCTKGSYDTYTCKLCGHTKTVSTGDPNGHMLIEKVKTVAPTCTAQGYTTYKCSNCDYTENKDFVDALGHSWDSSVVTPPTCTDKGYTTHTCSRCNETNVDTYVDATDHSYTEVVTPPTCTDKGYTTHTCHCGDEYIDTYVDATGHTYVGKITVQPSCKSTGIMTYTCHCGNSYEEIIPKSTDHNYVETIIIPPTCTETGTKNYICGCDEVRDTVDTVVPALGHDFSSLNWKVNVSGKDGSHHIKCSRCETYGYINEKGEPVVGSLPHNFDTVVTPPTCTKKGYTTYTCFCGDTFRDDVVDANGHSWNKGVVTDPPCCTKTGTMTYTCTTEGCGVTKTEDIPAEGLKNVVKTEAYDRSNYCGKWGYKAFWTCNKCGKIYADEKLTQVITSGNFKEINGVKVPEELAVEPVAHDFTGAFICIESGKNGKHAQKCVRYDNCGAYDEENAADHDWNDGVTTDPTHLKAGETRYTCEICNDQYADIIDRLATAHTFDVDKEASKPATCVTPGFIIEVCECGERRETKVPMLEHADDAAYETIEIPATCLKDGKEYKKYVECGCEFDHVTLPATGHTFGDVTPYKAATCANGGAKGNEAYKQCETCKLYFAADAEVKSANGVESTKTFEIAALQHTFFAGGNDVQKPEKDTLVSDATCTSPAVYKAHCDLCEVAAASITYTYGDPIAHDFVNGELKANDNGTHAAACAYGCGTYDVAVACSYAEVAAEHDEVNHKYVCACGNYTLEKHELPDEWTPVVGTDKLTRACAKCEYTEEIEKTQCVFNGVETTPATCTTDGVKTYTCTVHENCANNYTEEIPATGHLVYVESEKFLKDKATCQADAVYYKVCEACGEQGTETWSKEGTKLEHKWGKWTWANDTHSRACTTCVGTISTESAVCSGGVANCQDMAVCEVCNNAYGTTDSSKHKTVVTVPEVPATCQTAGTEAYQYCEDCKIAIEQIVTIPALDHTLTEWSKVEGKDEHTRSCTTCDENAEGGIYTETEPCTGGVANCQDKAKCTVCKAEYGTVNKANHKTEANHLDEASVVAATCQKKGFSGNYVYDCCGEIKKAGSTTDALEHTLAEASKTPATCIAKGSVTYECSKCVEDAANGLKVYTKTEELEINPKNHASEETKTVKDKEATCIEDGYTGDKYYVCCYDETKTESENRRALAEKGTVIKANGKHTYTEAVADYRVERIETVTDSEGNKTKNIVLKTKELTYDDMIASRHNDGKWYHVQLCTECYSIKYSACGAYEHTANCVETDICAACNGLCSLKKANVHKNIVEVEGTEATCTAEGLESYYKCEGCNKEFLDEAGKKKLDDKSVLVIPVADHDFDTTVTYPGEGENADKTYYRCKNYVSAENPDGCTAVKEVEPDDGGDDDDTPSVDDHEHVWSTDYKVTDEATCTEHGYEALYCTVEGCDAVKAGSYQQVTALGHAWNDGVVTTAATCEAEGVMTYECTRCGETKTEAIEKLGHDWDDGVITVQPTCKEAGEKTFTCKNDASHTYTESIAKGKHVVGDKIIRTEPGTCVKPAINWTACSVCGTEFSSEGEVDLTNHGNIVVVPGKEATCVSDGYTDAKVCSDCKTVIAESVEISHKDVPHHDHNGDGYCDECTFDLFDGSACDCICHKQNGLMKIIYKIIRFFWSIFGMNKSCRCGTVHY